MYDNVIKYKYKVCVLGYNENIHKGEKIRIPKTISCPPEMIKEIKELVEGGYFTNDSDVVVTAFMKGIGAAKKERGVVKKGRKFK